MAKTTKYTRGGKETTNTTTDDKKAYAKQVNAKYFILLDVSGDFYDFLHFEKPTGASERSPAKYVEVTKEVFDNYLVFLRTSNSFYLNKARNQHGR